MKTWVILDEVFQEYVHKYYGNQLISAPALKETQRK